MARTLNDIYIECKNRLNSEFEAREICAFALKIDRNKTFDWGFHFIGDESAVIIENLVKRRLNGEPLAYILGYWEFYSLPFKVTPDVLIPRPDTETLVDVALENIAKTETKVLDLCCGSGCIGIAILKNCENTKVIACDISENALSVAKFNAKLNTVHTRYMAIKKDALDKLCGMGKFDIIVSNPPYIKTLDIENLDVDVKNFEPKIALDGGESGYVFYENIIKHSKEILSENGKLIFECGINQEDEIERLFLENGYKNVRKHKDLCNVYRVLEAQIKE